MKQHNRRQEYERDLISTANVTLAKPRDEESWTRDPLLKQFKKNFDGSSSVATNYLIQTYLKSQKYLNANIHLTVGRQRL